MVETNRLVLSFHSESILFYFASLSTVFSHHSSLTFFFFSGPLCEQQKYLGLH